MSNLGLPEESEAARGVSNASRAEVIETTDLGIPAVGALAYDHRSDRVGQVMELHRTYAVLRPTGGGREWFLPLGYLHKPQRAEELRRRVAELNAASRWGL